MGAWHELARKGPGFGVPPARKTLDERGPRNPASPRLSRPPGGVSPTAPAKYSKQYSRRPPFSSERSLPANGERHEPVCQGDGGLVHHAEHRPDRGLEPTVYAFFVEGDLREAAQLRLNAVRAFLSPAPNAKECLQSLPPFAPDPLSGRWTPERPRLAAPGGKAGNA